MDKKRLYLFLLENLEASFTLSTLKARFYKMYAEDDLNQMFAESKQKSILMKVYNPYPTDLCDDCENEVELDKITNGYSAIHRCGKIEKSFEEIDLYNVNEKELLEAIPNDFGYKITTVQQAKIKLRRDLKEVNLYQYILDKETHVLTINGDKILLKEGSKLAQTSLVISYFFNTGFKKVEASAIEDLFHHGNFLNTSEFAGNLSKLNQKIQLETGLKLNIRFVLDHLIIQE